MLQSNMEINVKVESTGADAKVNIDSSTTVGNVIEMVARSPQMYRKFVFNFIYIKDEEAVLLTFFSCCQYTYYTDTVLCIVSLTLVYH